MRQNKTEEQPRRFIDRMSVYGLEFAVAMITLVVTISVLSFGAYALCGYLVDNASTSSSRGYFALWTAASTIVWLPVAVIFYLRSRAYAAYNPEIVSNPVQRTFVIIYQVVMTLTIISFAVAAVYAALLSLVRVEDSKEIFLSAALPSLISAILFGGAMVAFFKRPVVSRKLFVLLLVVASALIVIPVVALSISSLRTLNLDSLKVSDLRAIESAIDREGRMKQLPASLVSIKKDIDGSVGERLDDYEYKRIDSNRYELCATFAASSSSRVASSTTYSERYTTYGSFSSHRSGRQCFKLQVFSSVYDYQSQSYRR